MRTTIAAIVAALAAAAPAAALAPPVMDDQGGTPWSCAWNPYARIDCNGLSCHWTGEFQWRDLFGNFTGERCA